jgi:hypothetical protein
MLCCVYREWIAKKFIVEQIEYSIIDKLESIWWVNIQNTNGQSGWSDEPDNFGNKDAFE